MHYGVFLAVFMISSFLETVVYVNLTKKKLTYGLIVSCVQIINMLLQCTYILC
jgi:hypothetical protein